MDEGGGRGEGRNHQVRSDNKLLVVKAVAGGGVAGGGVVVVVLEAAWVPIWTG